MTCSSLSSGFQKLKGTENTYRLRVGKCRVLYRIYDDEVIVVIIRIVHRSKVYRKI
ncbi:MAG: type II toxin-antitoxin system RelE/ParE family toxin [Candidatus Odinarchaeota archaeon]